MSKEIKQQRMNARDEASQLFCSKPATKVKSTLGTGERPLKPCGTI